MKFRCETKKLYSALQLVSTIIPSKSPREILQNVLIDASEGTVQFAGTDLEVGIRFVLPDVEVEEAGTLLSDANKLTQILREAQGDMITFESSENYEFTITYEGSRYNLNGFDPEEYPDVPVFSGDYVEIDAPTLTNMIQHTAFAAAKESMRFAINGVLFVVQDSVAHMVGTDGHRLSWIKKAVDIAKDVSFRGIVPLKALDMMLRLISDSEEPVKLKLEENYILAQCGPGLIASKLVEGNYPNYEDVIPRENDKIVIIDVDALRSGIRQAAILTSEESRAVRTSFEDGKMTMSARIPERGGAVIERTVDYEGSAVKIGLNPEYILDLLKVTSEGKVRIELKDKDRPALIKTGSDFLYVVMPVSIED